MKGNLKTTKYNDGTPVTYITDATGWITAGEAYCWCANYSATYKTTYGALYNWYTADPSSNGNRYLCPTDWHVRMKTPFGLINLLIELEQCNFSLSLKTLIEKTSNDNADQLWYKNLPLFVQVMHS